MHASHTAGSVSVGQISRLERRRRKEPPSGKQAEEKARMAKFRRGDPVATRAVTDKKLRGQLRHSEALAQRAQQAAAKAEQWLLPDEAGGLEAEGLERTWRFSQVAACSECVLCCGHPVRTCTILTRS